MGKKTDRRVGDWWMVYSLPATARPSAAARASTKPRSWDGMSREKSRNVSAESHSLAAATVSRRNFARKGGGGGEGRARVP